MKYTIYKLDFYGTDKFYIGCTRNTGRRFDQHKCSEQWLDLCIMPKCMTVLKETESVKEASFLEYKWICNTWEDNLNKNKIGYPITDSDWTKEDRLRQEWYDSVEAAAKLVRKLNESDKE